MVSSKCLPPKTTYLSTAYARNVRPLQGLLSLTELPILSADTDFKALEQMRTLPLEGEEQVGHSGTRLPRDTASVAGLAS